ncbi:MAG: hypothetical protein IJD12_03180 [Tidjanibacter sp.]|nr:hypothetical protein [Tidjanibacter sp.]
MKNRLLTTLIVLTGVFAHSYAQINVRTEGETAQAQQEEIVYDSLSNFNFGYKFFNKEYQTEHTALENVKKYYEPYIGQCIYFRPLPQEAGYRSSEDAKRDKLRGRYFTIDGFEYKVHCVSYSSKWRLNKVVFKLRDENKKKYKWELDCALPTRCADFSYKDVLHVGYYEKLKQQFVGKSFIYTDRVEHILLYSSIRDTKTDESVDLQEGEEWKCVDIQLVDSGYSMPLCAILSDSNGREIMVIIENSTPSISEVIKVTSIPRFMEKSEFVKWSDSLIEKYGLENALAIICRDVKVGMTEQMCIEAWGEPKKKNTTFIEGVVSEQWVYGSGLYLYFDNGILTTIQG